MFTEKGKSMMDKRSAGDRRKNPDRRKAQIDYPPPDRRNGKHRRNRRDRRKSGAEQQ